MRFGFAALLLVAASHGGGGCAHMEAGPHPGAEHAGHVGNVAQTGAHLGVPPWATGSASFHATHPTAPRGFFPTLASGIRHALDASAEILAAALSADPDAASPAPPAEAPCNAVEDCGDGQLGHGAVCDRWTTAPRSAGVCRDACGDDADCPAPLQCRVGLDPDAPQWGGCI